MQAPGEAAHNAEHPASDVLVVHWAMVTVVPPVPPVPPQAVAVGVAVQRVIRAVHSAVGASIDLHWARDRTVVPPVPPVPPVPGATHAAPFQNCPPVQEPIQAPGEAAHKAEQPAREVLVVHWAMVTVVPPVPPVPGATHAAPFQNCPPVQEPIQAPGEAAHKAEHPARDVLVVHWAMVTVVPLPPDVTHEVPL